MLQSASNHIPDMANRIYCDINTQTQKVALQHICDMSANNQIPDMANNLLRHKPNRIYFDINLTESIMK